MALALAMKYPQEVQALILASGYYYPNARADVAILSPPAIPLIGDILSRTVSPLLSRLMWPLLLRKNFWPEPDPGEIQEFPEEMAVRPSQIRASAARSALMNSVCPALRKRYRLLQMPVAIVVGAEDRLIESTSNLRICIVIFRTAPTMLLPGTGHMVHQTTEEIVTAIMVADPSKARSGGGRRLTQVWSSISRSGSAPSCGSSGPRSAWPKITGERQ